MGTTRQDIERALFAGANSLRDTVDAANYKDYVLPIMFVRYLSDRYKEKVEEIQEQYKDLSEEQKEMRINRQISKYLPFTISKECTFDTLYQSRFDDNLGQIINVALRKIEDDNPAQLSGIFRSVDYNSEAALGERLHRNAILRELLEDFIDLDLKPSKIETEIGKVAADTVGDAYEYMIGQFAGMAGKKAGSFFTPQAVSEIMAKIVNAKPGYRIYDPTCGSGSLLIRAANKQNRNAVSVFGQEVSSSAVSMAKMNMFIHEIMDAKIGCGDTLANPLFLDNDGNLRLFDAIVANMPFSKDKWASGFNPGGENSGKGKEFKMESSLDKYHRFDWGVPPSSKGDWAFLMHMIGSLAQGGTIAAVVPYGVLFRGASEGIIRKKVVDENLLDAVIGLPENLFYGTSIPACILIFKRNRTMKDILFIDASGIDENGNPRFVKNKNQNELSQKHVEDIYNAYVNRMDKDKFAHVATIEEIKANEYNLNIPRYVDTFVEEEMVDIKEVKTNIENIKTELTQVEAKLAECLKELGL